MTGQVTAVVRLTSPSGAFAGMGVLVDRRRVVTCAHVVNKALGRDLRSQDEPDARATVRVTFPQVGPGLVREASPEPGVWTPPPPVPGAPGADVAGLTLGEDAPVGAAPAAFATTPGAPRAALRVFGYPADPPRAEGAWVDFVHEGIVENGRIQVESAALTTFKAQPGYSGSPVWSTADEVVGLLSSTARPDKEDERDAYLTSALVVAEVWPEAFEELLRPPNPYRGLLPFTSDDRGRFFGREEETASLVAAVLHRPVTVVLGASGVGKSSLVQAGLVPALGQDWVSVTARPGTDPWNRVAAALLRAEDAIAGTNGGVTRARLDDAVARLQRDGLLSWGTLADSQEKKLLLVVDQFEEVLSRPPIDDRLLDVLVPAGTGGAVRVVLTLRTDFLGELQQVPTMGPRLHDRLFSVSPPGPEAVREVIEQPASASGIAFDDDLVDEIVADWQGSLPLLEFTLERLWNTQRARRLTFAGYRAMGRVAGALNQFAEERLSELSGDTVHTVEGALLRMVRTPPGDRSRTTRQRASKAELGDDGWDAVQRLAGTLVVTDSDASHMPYAELAHESLVEAWDRLRDLVTANAEFLAWLGRVEDREVDDLLPDARIAEARSWLDARPEAVPARVRELVQASEAAVAARTAARTTAAVAEAERSRALEVAESLRLASEARDITADEPHTALLVAWEALLRDENEFSETVFRQALDRLPAELTTVGHATGHGAVRLGFINPSTAFVARSSGVVERVTVDGRTLSPIVVPGYGPLAVAPLPGEDGLLTLRDGVLRRHDGDGGVADELSLTDEPSRAAGGSETESSISCSTRRTCLVRTGDTGWLVDLDPAMTAVAPTRFEFLQARPDSDELLRADRSERVAALRDPRRHAWTDRIFRTQLDPGGRFVVSEARGGVRIWPVDEDGSIVLEGSQQVADTRVLAGGTIVTGSMAGEGATWSSSGDRLDTFRDADHRDLFIPAVGPTAGIFATTADRSGVVDVRDPEGAVIRTLVGPPSSHVWSAAFSPDGRLVATGADDGNVRVWSVSEGEPTVLWGHRRTVSEIAFHTTRSDVLLSCDQDGEARLWRLMGAAGAVWERHSRSIRSLVASDDGSVISTDDRSVTVWTPDGHATDLPGGWGDATAPGPGDRVLCTIEETNAHLWQLSTGEAPRALAEIPMPSTTVEVHLSPDGSQLLMVGHAMNDARVADTRTGRAKTLVGAPTLERVDPSYGQIIRSAFRPDGRRIVTAAHNGATWIWSADGAEVASFVTDTVSPDRTLDVACDPLGEFIATAVRHEVGLWDWDGRRVGSLAVAGYKVRRVVVSADGARILTLSDGPGGSSTELWSRDGERVADLPMVGPWQYAFPDPQGRYVAIDSDGIVVVGRDGDVLGRLVGRRGGYLRSAAVSSDGSLVAGCFSDGRVPIWDLATKRRIKTLRVDDCSALAFSADGAELLVGTTRGAIARHAIPVSALYATASRRVGGLLDPRQLERFGIDAPRLDLDALRDD